MTAAVDDSPSARPGLTDGFKAALAATGAALVALLVAIAPLSASLVEGHYLPIGPDSFYHARRILDEVAQPASFFQFDSLMHVPEGSLVTWPWAYDYLMSLLVRAALALHLTADPMAALVHIPVVAFAVTIAIVAVLCRALKLSTTATALALLATALFPLSQTLYGVGNIDHHYAEHMFVLGTLAASVKWLQAPQSRARAITAGVVLGIACGVHTSLFILQLPLVAAFAWLWIRRAPLPRTTPVFAGALVVATIAIALPSLPLREGHFEYYTLSWMQVYIAVCSATLCVLLSRVSLARRGVVVVAGTALLMLVPIVGQMALARDFFTVSVEGMDEISEVQSVWELWRRSQSLAYISNIYTYLVFLVPVTAILCGWRLWREADPARCVMWIASVFGLTLLIMQLRLQYFGSFALYLPWLVLLDDRVREGRKAALAWGAMATALFVAYLPGLKNYLFETKVPAGDPYYEVTKPVFEPLARECRQHPGIVLSNPNDGHYLRFHTRCGVIGNNFLVTAQHAAKVREEKQLLQLKASALGAAAPGVRYVFVRRDSMFFSNPAGELEFAPGDYPSQPDAPLVRELLNADAAQLPAGFRLLVDLRLTPNDPAYARVFALDAAR